MRICIFIILFFSITSFVFGQTLPVGFPIIEEMDRISQLKYSDSVLNDSYLIRLGSKIDSEKNIQLIKNIRFGFFPLNFSLFNNLERPYWYSPYAMIPSKGAQIYTSGGIYLSGKYFSIEVFPEFVFSSNSSFDGFSGFAEDNLNRRYFLDLRRGDSPELFGSGNYLKLGLGQSKIVSKLGSIELGLSNRNLWWGPGQWNSLTISNNAPGFLHGVFGTHRPAKTFFGSFEFQLISGFLNSKKYAPTQIKELNEEYFDPLEKRERYLNALSFSLNPKWVKGLHVGATRTVQTFRDSVNVKKFIDVFPVFWGITKEAVGSDLIGKSDKGRDQQISVFFRYIIYRLGFEFYGEYGRRDHALNIRDLILNPEHSRAFILGFNKTINLIDSKKILLRSEITHQLQSVNWITRPSSNQAWHTNGTVGGFSNFDQAMGVGIGTGSNIQIFELSVINNYNKIGFYSERLVQHADFYDVANLSSYGYKPWVDYTLGPIINHRWKNLLLSARVLFTYTNNYFWSQSNGVQDSFPTLNNKFSNSSQFNLIYYIK